MLKRVEVKYVLPRCVLPSILAALRTEYAVLEAGQRLNRTARSTSTHDDFAMYRRHHAGAADRFKVRRTYVDRPVRFWRSSTRPTRNAWSRNACRPQR
ncbi:MAG: hypothetical protein R2838_09850 [Caldilineaceae bacterium]